MIARTGREEVSQYVELPKAKPVACATCGEALGFDAWADSNGDLLAGPYDDSRCLKEGCINNR
jgi:hypothetical protein